ncbi:energy-coupling factor transporter ATPase [Evansella sp. LMS18]|uniref:energy-coupling factor transporter ATPase n=1 Tax=Evansella sp. LMS18 TaxID=2924033 RepID=UPI0020D0C1C0|nr:energy-coupling factor transporter ATPase [Evansella sp. LMS18]UTR12539.1 energy-coupling factor transporter ATPase [Evansella sp. LMS18]
MQIKANNVSHVYMPGTPFEKAAISNINVTLPPHTFTSVIGRTGSGKSTFVQLINGLLKPVEGSLTVGDFTITKHTKQRELYELRRKAGMVFQYPEHQLFEETILRDVAFGPENYGKTAAEAEKTAREQLAVTGLGENLFERSPFELSGGQMRRAAIAGVLALEPQVLILDEPTAGLDPQGQEDIMNMFNEWYQSDKQRSVILVTHNMEDAAAYSDQILVMDSGRLQFYGTPADVFSREDELKKLGLGVPESMRFLSKLGVKSGREITIEKFRLQDTVNEIVSFLGKD